MIGCIGRHWRSFKVTEIIHVPSGETGDRIQTKGCKHVNATGFGAKIKINDNESYIIV